MKQAKDTSLNSLQQIANTLKNFLHSVNRNLKKVKNATLTSFANWSDPKLAPYRKQTPKTLTQESSQSLRAKTTPSDKILSAPQTIEEFLDLMKRTPRSVLSQRERHVIAAIMNFPNVHVSELMLPKDVIVYVQEDEVLGPLTLDRLYRSGFQHFPVLDKKHQIIGLIHTAALNNLEVREASRARDILDAKVYYLREDYTLNQALAAFIRTNCYFFLIVDRFERIVGILTYQILTDYLLGETPKDKFDRDYDRLAVAKRKM